MNEFTLIQKIAIWELPILFAVTLHEVAHGWVARALGDDTAAAQGRLSLNPLKHVDPVGTVVVPTLLLVLGGFIFGWAKPVPVNFGRLRQPKRDMIWVAAAGPGANLLMAFVWGIALKVLFLMGVQTAIEHGLAYMCLAGILINLILMVLNLLPIPPLDGSRVVAGLLPNDTARQYLKIEPYGLVILLVLIATGVLGASMGPPMALAKSLVLGLLGLPQGIL